MTVSEIVAIAVVVLVGLAAYSVWLRERLTRLERLVRAARTSLEVQLADRVAVARRHGVAVGTGSAPADLEASASALSRALRAALADGPDEGTALELRTAAERVQLARQFHNDAVHSLRALRGRRAVRALRLAAGRPPPAYFEIDDAVTVT